MIRQTKTPKAVGMGLLMALMMAAFWSSYALITKQWQGSFFDLFLSAQSHIQTLDIPQLSVALSLIPTMTVAILAGGLLGVVSTLLQTLAKNNLASDSTLAVGSGAQMALLLAVLFVPSLGLYGSFWVAFVGALSSMGLVFLLALPSGMNPVVLVLSGLVINLLFSAGASVLLLFHSELTLGVLVWGSGVLTQTGHQVGQVLLAVLIILAVLIAPVYKSLILMQLDDTHAHSLGVPLGYIRTYLTVITAGVLAILVAYLGVIGFVGLAAATLTNALSVQKLIHRLLLSFVFGALILWTTNNALNLWLPDSFVGAGAITAILGAPLIIYLVLTLSPQKEENINLSIENQRHINIWRLGAGLIVLAIFALLFTPYVAGTGQAMVMEFGLNWQKPWLIGQLRLPRTLTAISAGMMLGVAGVLLQSLSKNPMASPEVLGISAATALGVVVGFWVLPLWGMAASMPTLFVFGVGGAVIALAGILALSRRVSSGHLLLVGIAISALMGGVLSIIKVSGDPRLFSVLSFLSGSTYYATLPTALVYLALALFGTTLATAFAPTLALLGFGRSIAAGRGVNVATMNVVLLVLVAILSVAATFAIGPLSFIGLMVPHLALMIGARTLGKRIIVSALLGAILLVGSDWVGRYVIFPYEIPAGTIASLIGGIYFAVLMRKLR